MNTQDADPDKYGIVVTSGPALTTIPNLAGQCAYCDLHSWTEMCPKMRCDCGSTVTITAIDQLDQKCVRRCFRCNAVAIWDKP